MSRKVLKANKDEWLNVYEGEAITHLNCTSEQEVQK